MAVAMQTDDFPYLPSGPAESMSCLFNGLTYVLEEKGAVALCKGPPCYSLKYRRCCYLRKANVSRYLSSKRIELLKCAMLAVAVSAPRSTRARLHPMLLFSDCETFRLNGY